MADRCDMGGFPVQTTPVSGTDQGGLPQAAPYADRYFSSVKSLLHCEGSNGSTSFPDSAGRVWTANGNAQVSTARSKYGASSLLLDGSGDYLSTPHHADLDLSSGDWTLEGFIYVNAYTAANMTIFNKDGVSGSSYPCYAPYLTSAGILSLVIGSGNGVSSVQIINSLWAIPVQTWTHWCWQKKGSTIYGFVDGNLEVQAAQTATMVNGSKSLLIGYESGAPSTAYFNGNMDEIRITKGVARYPTTRPFPFAVPSMPFADS